MSKDTSEAVHYLVGLTLRHVRRLTREGVLPLVRRNGKHPHYQTRQFGAAIFEVSKS
jgi:hypothetical protein